MKRVRVAWETSGFSECNYCKFVHNKNKCPYCGSFWKTVSLNVSGTDVISEQPDWYFAQLAKGKDEGELMDFLEVQRIERLL